MKKPLESNRLRAAQKVRAEGKRKHMPTLIKIAILCIFFKLLQDTNKHDSAMSLTKYIWLDWQCSSTENPCV